MWALIYLSAICHLFVSHLSAICQLHALVYATVDAGGLTHTQVLVLIQSDALTEALVGHPAQGGGAAVGWRSVDGDMCRQAAGVFGAVTSIYRDGAVHLSRCR